MVVLPRRATVVVVERAVVGDVAAAVFGFVVVVDFTVVFVVDLTVVFDVEAFVVAVVGLVVVATGVSDSAARASPRKRMVAGMLTVDAANDPTRSLTRVLIDGISAVTPAPGQAVSPTAECAAMFGNVVVAPNNGMNRSVRVGSI